MPNSLELDPRLPFWTSAARTRVAQLSFYALAFGLLACPFAALGNGGPFVLKYPGGDPAAKGVLARLDPSLKPAAENRLQVTREELGIVFETHSLWGVSVDTNAPPRALVTARYFISNPTQEQIDVDFGFPILRGIYISPLSMMPRPDVQVTVESGGSKTNARVEVISNSAIFGVIRNRARDAIESALTQTEGMRMRVQAVRTATGTEREHARQALREYLAGNLRWNERDSALLVEHASLDLGARPATWPYDVAQNFWSSDETLRALPQANLGSLSAIGEQKATQFLAQLARLLAPKSGADYEAIFAAWGGDVRERSLDLSSGVIRPREYHATEPKQKSAGLFYDSNPAVYARVDYLDPNAKITEAEKASCQAILQNLPVIFTFAPMNLLHYRVSFPPGREQVVTVQYSQFAYADTREPGSYQLSYVVHPASLWKQFGPIELRLLVPEGVPLKCSAPMIAGALVTAQQNVAGQISSVSPAAGGRLPVEKGFVEYRATIKEKRGELFVAIDSAAWQKHARALAERNRVAAAQGSKTIGAARPGGE